MRTTISAAILLATATALSSCGGSSNPCVYGAQFNALPNTGSADHTAAAPGNQFHFFSFDSPYVISGTNCPLPGAVGQVNATWTSSNPKAVSISSDAGETNGLATCLEATTTPVTLTASYTPAGSTTKTATASLTCQ